MIKEKEIKKAIERIIGAYKEDGLLSIYIFGSFAWGTPDFNSDIDIFVVVEKSDEKPYKRAVKGHRALKGVPIPADIIVFTKEEFEEQKDQATSFCYKIASEGIKCYEAA